MLPTDWMRQVALTRVDLLLEPLDPGAPHPYPEVAIRGALGAALWHIACVNPEQDCAACDGAPTCPIPSWYDPDRIGGHQVRPLVLQVDPSPAGWHVRLALLGGRRHSALVTQAILRMARHGIGTAKIRYGLRRFTVQGRETVDLLADPDAGWPLPGALVDFVHLPEWPEGAQVRLRSPTWWSGCSRRRPPTPPELLKAAIVRMRAVASAQDQSLARWWPEVEQVRGDWLDAGFVHAARRQARTGDYLDLSGWTGTLELGPEVAGFADLLAAAELLNLGKRSSAGGGRVELQWRAS